MNLGKDLQIERLIKQLQRSSLGTKTTIQDEITFSEFSGIFSKDQLKVLRSISSGKRKDSTFVLKCVSCMYPNASVLNNISLTGKKCNGIAREKMCEDNIKIINRMLNERINSEESDQVLTLARLGNVKKLIRDAITLLRKRSNGATSNTEQIRTDRSEPLQQAHSTTFVKNEPEQINVFSLNEKNNEYRLIPAQNYMNSIPQCYCQECQMLAHSYTR